MPTLDALLRNTLLLTAAPQADYQSFGGDSGTAEAAAKPRSGKHWSWTHDPEHAGQVTHVTYDLPGTPWYDAQTPTVLDALVWHPIELTHGGRTYTLELSKEFLLRKYEASQGSIVRGQSAYWIPADIDQSMLLVFGFQVNLRAPAGTLELEPIPEGVLAQDDFMPWPNAKPPKAPVMKVRAQETGTLQLIPFRVLVCAEFVCCTERDDYLPGGLALTSRFRPHLMFVANRDLERMAAKISVRRPAMSTMAHNAPKPAPPPPHP
ncbi:hypothetical protein D7X74_26145, partial [Corallococcus sp. CA047B]|uniref:hypothetical protein n=1 Tax=Corallococcus sp. CA047B TaxID=2316729 RepID=UPI000EEFDFD4